MRLGGGRKEWVVVAIIVASRKMNQSSLARPTWHTNTNRLSTVGRCDWLSATTKMQVLSACTRYTVSIAVPIISSSAYKVQLLLTRLDSTDWLTDWLFPGKEKARHCYYCTKLLYGHHFCGKYYDDDDDDCRCDIILGATTTTKLRLQLQLQP